MKEKTEKDFTKWNVSTSFTVAGRCVYVHKETMWKEM
jgi:hypothetical protein